MRPPLTLALALALALLAGCLPGAVAPSAGPPPRRTPAQIAASADSAVVLIRTPGGLGSGFAVGASGLVATAYHVIRNADSAAVILSDGREIDEVSVVATDADHDLAVLRIPARLHPLEIGQLTEVRPGDDIVVIGHPEGLSHTVSTGVVSAIRDRGGKTQKKALQISAPIAPGSSGGPVLDGNGRVIGVVSSLLVKGQNLNFAAPADELLPLIAVNDATPLREFRRRLLRAEARKLFRGCSDGDLAAVRSAVGELRRPPPPGRNPWLYQQRATELLVSLDGCSNARRYLLLTLMRSDAISDEHERARMLEATLGVLAVSLGYLE